MDLPIEKLSTGSEIHYVKEMTGRLESVIESDDEGMPKVGHDVPLSSNIRQLLGLAADFSLIDDLTRK